MGGLAQNLGPDTRLLDTYIQTDRWAMYIYLINFSISQIFQNHWEKSCKVSWWKIQHFWVKFSKIITLFFSLFMMYFWKILVLVCWGVYWLVRVERKYQNCCHRSISWKNYVSTVKLFTPVTQVCVGGVGFD